MRIVSTKTGGHVFSYEARIVVALLALSMAGGKAAGEPTVYRDWRIFTSRDGLPDSSVRALCTHEGKLWAGTDRGLALYAGGGWRSWTEQDGLPWPAVSAIAVSAKTGDVWMGTWGGGLVRFSAGRFDSFTQFNSGLAGNLVFAVVVEGHRVWASTTGGISVFDTVSGDWELHLERRADRPEAAFIDLDLDEANGKLYATAWCGSIHGYDLNAPQWTAIEAEVPCRPGQPKSCATSMALVPENEDLWLITRSDLYRRERDGDWELRPRPIDLGASVPLTCLALGRAGLWVGGSDGLYSRSEDGWVAYRAGDRGSMGRVCLARLGREPENRHLGSAFPAGGVQAIAVQGDVVWVATAEGLARGGNPVACSTLAVAPDRPADPIDQRDVRISRHFPMRSPGLDTSALNTVTIASFGPITRTIRLSGAPSHKQPSRAIPDTLSIQIAVEQANQIGGHRGQKPFDATYGTHGYAHYAWGLPEDDLTLFARRPIFGVLASLRPEDRIATAVALRMELPVVNVDGTPSSIEEEASSWIFRCRTHDARQHDYVIDYLRTKLGRTRYAVLRTPGAMTDQHLDLWKRSIEQGGVVGGQVVADIAYLPGVDQLSVALDKLQRAAPDTVLTWADSATSAKILRAVRDRGLTSVFVGSDLIVCDGFTESAGPGLGPVVAPNPCPHRRNREAAAHFDEVYTRQNSPSRERRPPRADAYRTYDAARHLLLAVNIAGLDRKAVREVLAKMGEPSVAILQDGIWQVSPHAAED